MAQPSYRQAKESLEDFEEGLRKSILEISHCSLEEDLRAKCLKYDRVYDDGLPQKFISHQYNKGVTSDEYMVGKFVINFVKCGRDHFEGRVQTCFYYGHSHSDLIRNLGVPGLTPYSEISTRFIHYMYDEYMKNEEWIDPDAPAAGEAAAYKDAVDQAARRVAAEYTAVRAAAGVIPEKPMPRAPREIMAKPYSSDQVILKSFEIYLRDRVWKTSGRTIEDCLPKKRGHSSQELANDFVDSCFNLYVGRDFAGLNKRLDELTKKGVDEVVDMDRRPAPAEEYSEEHKGNMFWEYLNNARAKDHIQALLRGNDKLLEQNSIPSDFDLFYAHCLVCYMEKDYNSLALFCGILGVTTSEMIPKGKSSEYAAQEDSVPGASLDEDFTHFAVYKM